MSTLRILAMISILFVQGWLFYSCDNTRLFDRFDRIPEPGWHADSLMQFRFDVADTTRYHSLYFNIRNDRNYGFSNLWLFVSILPPRGEHITDTIQVILANPAGKWFGKGFSGLYTSQVPYRTHVYFPVSGTYTIQIQHGMRPTVLKGITDIGIRVEKTGL